MKNKKTLILGILIVVGIVVATIGVTYSLFNYTKHGSTESVIRSGGISFYYDEMTKRGVSITDALPVDSNNDAKGANNYFEFRITANTQMAEIPYVLTARLTEDSNMPLTGIRVYLTKVNDGVESEVLYTTLDQLVEKQFLGNYTDKVLYRDRVPVNGSSYEQKYRLRIWIDEDVNFSTGEWNDKRLSLQVNVYTNEGENLTSEHLTYPSDTEIKMISANNTYMLTDSSEAGIDYEVVVPNEVTQVNFDTTTKNMLATVSVTSLGTTPVAVSSNYNLAVGSNYFKITVTSADNTQTKDYKVKVERALSQDNSLTSLSVNGYAFTEEFDANRTSYTVAGIEADTITISANNPNGATITGTGEKTLTWGTNTFNVTVQAQDPTVSPKTYTITVNNVRPTAPEITGGSSSWVSTAQTISIVSPGTAVSGIAGYEYYKTTSTTAPTDSTTGIILSSPYEVEVTEGGTTYVYYRTVSVNGNKSLWSSAQIVNKNYTFSETILTDNTLITAAPTLTQASSNCVWNSSKIDYDCTVVDIGGLYAVDVENGFGGSDGTTYYFRGNVTNNYVDFAGKTWRVVRINEDGTVRLILDDRIDTTYAFNSNYNNYSYTYYSNSEIKSTVNTWYNSNIGNNSTYASKVASGNYFCEAAKVKATASNTSGSATMTVFSSYTPDFKCATDGNGYGLVNASVGLLTYDEVVRAGGYCTQINTRYYLRNRNFFWWTMSSSGFNINSDTAGAWVVYDSGNIDGVRVYRTYAVRPVINLKSTVTTTGTGTASDPYVIQ